MALMWIRHIQPSLLQYATESPGLYTYPCRQSHLIWKHRSSTCSLHPASPIEWADLWLF
jgi:hypothetical protein